MYAMQRANGDWFAFAEDTRLRVPVFHSSGDAMSARRLNAGMLLFKPIALDACAIHDMVVGDENSAAYFWLVNNPFTNVNRGHLIEQSDLARLIHDAKTQDTQGPL
jgi:hypothetical protein